LFDGAPSNRNPLTTSCASVVFLPMVRIAPARASFVARPVTLRNGSRAEKSSLYPPMIMMRPSALSTVESSHTPILALP